MINRATFFSLCFALIAFVAISYNRSRQNGHFIPDFGGFLRRQLAGNENSLICVDYGSTNDGGFFIATGFYTPTGFTGTFAANGGRRDGVTTSSLRLDSDSGCYVLRGETGTRYFLTFSDRDDTRTMTITVRNENREILLGPLLARSTVRDRFEWVVGGQSRTQVPTSSPTSSPTQAPSATPTLAPTGRPLGVLQFWEGNNLEQRNVCNLFVETQFVNFQQDRFGCENDEARSMTWFNVDQRCTVTVYDSPDGNLNDDFTIFRGKRFARNFSVGTFETDIENGPVEVDFQRHNGLDGKVSAVRIDCEN